MKYGFIKVATATPKIRVADCSYNAKQAANACIEACNKGAEIVCLPELSITGYTCGDLFFQNTLQNGTITALNNFASATKNCDALLFVGAPLVYNNAMYNCAVAVQKGEILGVVAKTHLPNYSEFYEMRHFTPYDKSLDENNATMFLQNKFVPFGSKLIFKCASNSVLKVAVEICEDLWAPIPPSCHHALAGATLIVNLSASDETTGKADYRKSLICGQSARLLCGYAYCDAGDGESTTDMVFAGHNVIAENGTLLAQSTLFENECTISEIDVEKLFNERIKNTTFEYSNSPLYREIEFTVNHNEPNLLRTFSPTPFVLSDKNARENRCEEILSMQANGLAKRVAHSHANSAVIGISGGLDSCLALIVTVRAFKAIKMPLENIIAVTMPCFGTTQRTRDNAQKLCEALGVTLKCVDITKTVNSNFEDIGHDEATHDVTFENVQARVRTLVLMNTANKTNGLVIGTGDLSELALGWATYNGDHMSMYGVNCSVPKTLIRYLVEYTADISISENLKQVLYDILNTPVSPELLPAKDGNISQQTEEIVGPYALHDFFLYYLVRLAFSPAKIYFLAKQAFNGEYSNEVILKWLRVFYARFFAQQFKRSCIPDGPKVGSVTLSPRSDWRMPSDACATLWIEELNSLN